jgi:hypothetical protein
MDEENFAFEALVIAALGLSILLFIMSGCAPVAKSEPKETKAVISALPGCNEIENPIPYPSPKMNCFSEDFPNDSE